MRHFPVFLAVSGRRVAVSGGGAAALAKLRLLLKTEARIEVLAESPLPEIEAFARDGRLRLERRRFGPSDARGRALVYAANENPEEDARVADIARAEGALINIVDNLEDSAFLTPAIVDRDPVVVAIGTEGAAPVLARRIKAEMEEKLPMALGLLARVGKAFRPMVAALSPGRARRDFWSEFYNSSGPMAAAQGGEEQAVKELSKLLARHRERSAPAGRISFVGAGPGDPELLTLKARKALDAADVVIHDQAVSGAVLELARREAEIVAIDDDRSGTRATRPDVGASIVEHASRGAWVVRLVPGDPSASVELEREIARAESAGLEWDISPGIPEFATDTTAPQRDRACGVPVSAKRASACRDLAKSTERRKPAPPRPRVAAGLVANRVEIGIVQRQSTSRSVDATASAVVVGSPNRPIRGFDASTRIELTAEFSGAAMPDAGSGPVLAATASAPNRVQESVAP